MKRIAFPRTILCRLLLVLASLPAGLRAADTEVRLTNVPDYDWYAGCFGTGTGNLMGYWDRNGFPNFYTGPTGGGLAPTNSSGPNTGIRSMWASKAGVDGRPLDQPGHIDDYWLYYQNANNYSYESTAPDPYITAGRAEHAPDCIGDFIGLSQMKWTNIASLNNECVGNIDAYSFVFWDTNGHRRVNHYQTNGSDHVPDIQSGLREWTRYRGHDADVSTQLADFNPHVPAGRGFTFENLKAEIDAGYPVLLYLQPHQEFSRSLSNPNPVPNANPSIHGMLAYGYGDYPGFGTRSVFFRTSWGVGEYNAGWDSGPWVLGFLPVRGLIGYHPKPKAHPLTIGKGNVTLSWDGPSSRLEIKDVNSSSTTFTNVHRYEVEYSPTLIPAAWQTVAGPTTNHTATFASSASGTAFYRVKLLP